MFSEFKKFAFRGNVMDLAVGVMIGGAFNSIVNSLVNDVFMPLFGLLFNTKSLSEQYILLKGAEGFEKGMSIAEATAAGATVLSYGKFLSAVINFLLISLIVFFIVKLINKLKTLGKKEEEAAPAPEPRLCPFCKTAIPDDAVRCPHCTSELPEPETAEEAAEAPVPKA